MEPQAVCRKPDPVDGGSRFNHPVTPIACRSREVCSAEGWPDGEWRTAHGRSCSMPAAPPGYPSDFEWNTEHGHDNLGADRLLMAI